MDSTFWRLLTLARPIAGWLLLATLLGVAMIASGIGLMTTFAYLISEHTSIAVVVLENGCSDSSNALDALTTCDLFMRKISPLVT